MKAVQVRVQPQSSVGYDNVYLIPLVYQPSWNMSCFWEYNSNNFQIVQIQWWETFLQSDIFEDP